MSKHHENSEKSMEERKRKAHRNILLIIIIFLVFVIVGLVFMMGKVLNQMNYHDPEVTLQVDPEIEKEKVNLPKEYEYVDKEIEENVVNTERYSYENVMNILLVGVDKGSATQYYPRSDSMMILSINKNDSTIRLASLSRAVYVAIPGFGNARLNAAHAYGGPTLLIKTIESNYKINIDNFISVDFDAFREIVNIFDGVDIYLSQKEALYVANALKGEEAGESSFMYRGEGSYHLDGESALMYARIRKLDNDRNRTGRQRKILTAIAQKAKAMSVSQMIQVIDNILPHVTTDLKKSEIMSQITKIFTYLNWNMQQTVIPDKSSNLKIVDSSKMEVLIVNWNETINYARSFFYPPVKKENK